MTSKHTPGPWKLEFNRLISNRACSWTFRANGYLIGESFLTGTSEGEANAHLIAAAPEMYEALRVLAEEMEYCNRESPQSMHMTIPYWAKRARAALAKAEGRS